MKAKEIPSRKIDAWIELMRAQNRLLQTIEAALKNAGLPPLSWYDVLLELCRPNGDGLRPMDLEKRLLLPQYGMSRLLDRIVKAGLIERRKSPEDGRGQTLHVTNSGQKMRREMWPVYAAALDDAFASKLTLAEADQIRKLMERFHHQVNAS